MPKKEQLFCSSPFRKFMVRQRRFLPPVGGVFKHLFRPAGDVFMCCTDWLRTPPIGNIQHQSVDEIWNGEKAQEIRRSILDGSFRYCDRIRCPFLQSISFEVQRVETVNNEELKNIIEHQLTILHFKPREIDCSFETSCNLSCPSCRPKVRVHSANEHEILNIKSILENDAFKDVHVLSFSSAGDPFGSPFYRQWLQTMNRKKIPHLKQIRLHTNALLWTPKMWSTIPAEIQEVVKSTIISIDAGRPETYAINRRGSSFERLLKNLQFIRLLRKHGPLEHVQISMVVQKNNFMEMPDFIYLGKSHNFDTVYFNTLQNWGTFSEKEYRDRAIHLPDHPRNSEFIDMFKNEIFYDPIVEMGIFRGLLPAR